MRTSCLLTVSLSIPWISGAGLEEEGGLPTPLDADPPGGRPPESDPPGGRPLQKADPLDADPLEAKLRSPVNRMTHASENITLPQTSFAGGKNGLKDFLV